MHTALLLCLRWEGGTGPWRQLTLLCFLFLETPPHPPATHFLFWGISHLNQGAKRALWGFNLPTVRKAVDRAEPCSLMASQRNSPARSGVTLLRRREPQPTRGTERQEGSVPAGGGLWGLGWSTWVGWLSTRPLLSYQRIRGAGRPVALQDRVTSPPATTVVFTGEETMMGTVSLPGEKYNQRMNSAKGNYT